MVGYYMDLSPRTWILSKTWTVNRLENRMSHENMFDLTQQPQVSLPEIMLPIYSDIILISQPEISQWSLLLSGRIYAFADCLAVREGTSPRSWVSQPLGPYGKCRGFLRAKKKTVGFSDFWTFWILFRWQCTKRWNTGEWTSDVKNQSLKLFTAKMIWLVTCYNSQPCSFGRLGGAPKKKLWQLLLKVQKLPWDRCWSQKMSCVSIICWIHLQDHF